MKKLIFVATVLTVVAFASGALAAQQKATPAPAKAAPAAQAWNVAVGVLEKIDAAAKTFDFKKIVKPKGKKAIETMMTFATDDKTKFFTITEKGKEKKLGFADLKTGMNLAINYKVEAGKNIATSVKVAGK
jgi:hypothetical protein